MVEVKKRRPVTHKHPAIAAAIHVLKDVGGGPLPAVVIFRRAHDRGLLAASAYNTLRARLSQHQLVGSPVIVKTDAGYMLASERAPADTPRAACAPNRPPLPGPLAVDPLAVDPTPRPARRRKEVEPTRVRDIRITSDWLAERAAPQDVVKWARLARWQARWEGETYPTAGDMLHSWLPVDVVAWLIAALPVTPAVAQALAAASGQAERRRILASIENLSSEIPATAEMSVGGAP